MAGDHNTRAKGRYYSVPSSIKDVPAVTKTRIESTDTYVGTANDLVATGLLTLDMLPGQPGMPTASACFRPRGRRKAPGSFWFRQPGYMQVFRILDGRFRVVLYVGHEERAVEKAAHMLRATQVALIVKHYPPRFSCYIGTRAQLLATQLLPPGTTFPVTESLRCATPFARWKTGQKSYTLDGRFRSQADKTANVWDGDHWELRIFDDRYRLSENLVAQRRQELAEARNG